MKRTEISLAAIDAIAYRIPIETPVVTAFGAFRDRPMVLVRAVDREGTVGWGEIWSNFPAVGAEHRARLVGDLVEPRVVGRSFADAAEAFISLTRELEVLVLQTAEVGPIAQVLAGVDIALWDLTARKAGVPLYRFLGGDSVDSVPVYASGLNPSKPETLAAKCYERGHRAFKLKTGFGRDKDVANLNALRRRLGEDVALMIDANQAHDLAGALEMCRAFEPFGLKWFEEPMRVDALPEAWSELAAASSIPLAGGENMRGKGFDAALALGALRVLQPDVTKWGGFSGTLPVVRKTLGAGKRYCPHNFGGGIAMMASLHLLAAAGGDGLLEYDANPNAARELIVGSLLPVRDGRVPVPQTPGLGVTPDVEALERYRTWPQRR